MNSELHYKQFFNVWRFFSRKYPKKAYNLENHKADILYQVFTKYDPNRGKFISYAYNIIRGRFSKTVSIIRESSLNDFPEDIFSHYNHDYDKHHIKNKISRMKNLTSSEKAILLLTLDGMDRRSISKKLGITLNTINQHYIHGVKKLKIFIGNKGEYNENEFSK